MGNGGQDEHVKERVRKGAAVMGQVWGIEKKKFGKDWGRRCYMPLSVHSVLAVHASLSFAKAIQRNRPACSNRVVLSP